MRIHYSATRRCKQTGRRYRVLGSLRWGQWYFSCDWFFDTRATSMAEAKRLAIASDKMAWLDEAAKP